MPKMQGGFDPNQVIYLFKCSCSQKKIIDIQEREFQVGKSSKWVTMSLKLGKKEKI